VEPGVAEYGGCEVIGRLDHPDGLGVRRVAFAPRIGKPLQDGGQTVGRTVGDEDAVWTYGAGLGLVLVCEPARDMSA
jgi:hypothetical protein